jgi:hypothetical protein
MNPSQENLGRWALNGHFSLASTCFKQQNTKLVQDNYQNPIMPTIVFLVGFGAHLNILFIVKVKVYFLSYDHIGPSQLYESIMVKKNMISVHF